MMAFTKTLLAFVDYQDPFLASLVGEEEQLGPILSLAASRPFQRAVLFHTRHTEENAELTVEFLRKRHPDMRVERIPLRGTNPKDFSRLIAEVAPHCRQLVESGERLDLAVCASSGTAEMRAIWMLLASTGALPARMLQVDPPEPGSGDPPNVVEMSPSGLDWLQQDRFLRRTVPDFSQGPGSRPTAPVVYSIEHEATPQLLRAEASSLARFLAGPTLEQAQQTIGIFAGSAVMWQAVQQAQAFAEMDLPVVIQGETGTGKGLFAKLIHELSKGPDRPFVTVDCAALSTETLQQSLFSAHGKFMKADGGTIFLDELPELSLESQGKLLRAVEDGTIEPPGEAPRHVRVRIVAATNRPLADELQKGSFRLDLYYRLNDCILDLPALRERKDEIEHLAAFLLKQINRTVREPRRLSSDAIERLRSHNWPGNVREFKNVLMVSVLSAKQELIRAADLKFPPTAQTSDPLHSLPAPFPGFKVKEFLERIHDWYFDRALEITGQNQQQASLLLGVTKAAVGAYLKKKMLKGKPG